VLLGYYVLAKTQEQLANVMPTTQTLVSSTIRQAWQRLSSVAVLGKPTAEVMAPIFIDAGLEHQLATPLSKAAEMYARTRSFHRVAEVLDLRRRAVH
jgi:hypothetical protein